MILNDSHWFSMILLWPQFLTDFYKQDTILKLRISSFQLCMNHDDSHKDSHWFAQFGCLWINVNRWADSFNLWLTIYFGLWLTDCSKISKALDIHMNSSLIRVKTEPVNSTTGQPICLIPPFQLDTFHWLPVLKATLNSTPHRIRPKVFRYILVELTNWCWLQ